MRHQVAGKRLGRDKGHRIAMRRNLIKALFRHERIKTTEAKAHAIRGDAEKMITMAKRALAHEDSLREVHARRLLMARLNDKEMVAKIFSELAPRYEDRPGGYTRMYKLGLRKGDSARMMLIELVDREAD
ncbi:MAG: 50S ribosomal protein L17 [Anaerolineae bacterium]|nr:50S ribosomal protein L17 [Anaerolineae bacterium]